MRGRDERLIIEELATVGVHISADMRNVPCEMRHVIRIISQRFLISWRFVKKQYSLASRYSVSYISHLNAGIHISHLTSHILNAKKETSPCREA